MRLSLSIILAIFALAISGCDSPAHLAESMAGSWDAGSVKIDFPDDFQSNANLTYDFIRDDGQDGGGVILTSWISVSRPFSPSVATSVTPINDPAICVKGSGVASVSGSWYATENNEIFVTFDPRTVSAKVDTTNIEILASDLLASHSPALETLKPAIAEQLKQDFIEAVDKSFLPMRYIDDIRFASDSVMHWKIKDVPQVLRRVMVASPHRESDRR